MCVHTTMNAATPRMASRNDSRFIPRPCPEHACHYPPDPGASKRNRRSRAREKAAHHLCQAVLSWTARFDTRPISSGEQHRIDLVYVAFRHTRACRKVESSPPPGNGTCGSTAARRTAGTGNYHGLDFGCVRGRDRSLIDRHRRDRVFDRLCCRPRMLRGGEGVGLTATVIPPTECFNPNATMMRAEALSHLPRRLPADE
jgi:hypothetical protein